MNIYRKTAAELEQLSIDSLKGTRLNNISDGSRVLSIIRAVNLMIQQFYDDLDRNIDSRYFSKAEGVYLDLIGELVDCTRKAGENNDNYRYRIGKQIHVVAGGNKTSLEVETKGIEGVSKVIFKKFTRGIGSYSGYVISDSMDRLQESVSDVQVVLDKKSSFGIRGVAESPRILPVRMSMNLVFKAGTSTSAKASILSDVRRQVKTYIDKLEMGEQLIASALFQIIRNVRYEISDVIINGIYINSRPILVSNYKPHWDEKLYVSKVSDIEVH